MQPIEVPGHGWVEFPDEMTDEQIVAAIQALPPLEPPQIEQINPVDDMSGMERFNAGMGAGMTNLAQGAKQIGLETGNRAALSQMLSPQQQMTLLARGDDLNRKLIPDFAVQTHQKEIDDTRRLQSPLMQTKSGLAGNIAGNVAVALPAALVPGANTYAGSAITSGLMGMLQPTSEDESRGFNTAAAAALSIPGKFAGDMISVGVGALNNKVRSMLAARQAQNSVRDATMTAGREAGYALPPSTANPSVLNRFLEGVTGKAGIGQSASLKNQSVTNKLGRQALGLPGDAPLTEQALRGLRAEAGKAYDVIKNAPGKLDADTQFADDLAALGGDFSEAAAEFPDLVKNEAIEKLQQSLSRQQISPKAAIELVKKLRFDASKNFKSFDDPAKAALGQAQRKAAEALDNLIERNLKEANLDRFLGPNADRGAVEAYKQARVLIAKTYDVESALNESTGNLSASALAKALEKGKPMTGELETIAKFARAFPTSTKPTEPLSAVLGGTPLDMAMGGAAAYGSGDPRLLALSLIRPSVRAGIMSKAGQSLLASPPGYGLPLKNKALGLLQNQFVQQGMRVGLPAGLLAQ